ncbi:MAG: glycosyl transferase family 1, partial [Flavobacteriales bacterium]|nr:glycosyl transferase family 1 [Flavobacteriales bacterium]
MKKVLIVTYYWPPSGGAGVQRWLKFTKYIREYGWEPVIYTIDNGEIPVEDQSLSSDIPENLTVLKEKGWEPYGVYKRFIGKKKSDKVDAGFISETKVPSRSKKIAAWIRGNIFIPDARAFWIRPSIKFLKNYLKNHHVDAIVSTGPPHSTHLIAKGV